MDLEPLPTFANCPEPARCRGPRQVPGARRALASLAKSGVVVRRHGRAGPGRGNVSWLPHGRPGRTNGITGESEAVNRLVNRRMLFECANTRCAARNATAEQLHALARSTHSTDQPADWSVYH